MSALRGRVPGWLQVIPVYGVIAIIVCGWTLIQFFWWLPGWLYFLNGGEILKLLAYSLATNFAESILILCGPVFLALVLPKKWFHDVFIARGTALSITALGYIMFLVGQFQEKNDYHYPPAVPPGWTVLLAAVVIAVLVYVFGQVVVLRKTLEFVADRASIFTYVLAPLGMISLLVVVVLALTG